MTVCLVSSTRHSLLHLRGLLAISGSLLVQSEHRSQSDRWCAAWPEVGPTQSLQPSIIPVSIILLLCLIYRRIIAC
jgi:hypothetical protein